MIGNNSCGIHSVMAEFYGPGPFTADQVVELDILTYDGHRMAVGATPEQELRPHRRRRPDRRAEIYRALRDAARRARARDPHRISRHPAARVGIQPRPAARGAGLRRRQGTGRDRGHLRDRAARDRPPHRRPTGTHAGGARLPRRIPRRGPRPDRARAPPGGSGGHRLRSSSTSCARRACIPTTSTCSPTGDGFLLVEFGARHEG